MLNCLDVEPIVNASLIDTAKDTRELPILFQQADELSLPLWTSFSHALQNHVQWFLLFIHTKVQATLYFFPVFVIKKGNLVGRTTKVEQLHSKLVQILMVSNLRIRHIPVKNIKIKYLCCK